ncbi:hypothetical protein [Novosphingobium sp. BW1]|uniref:hypothetical protein n=1 Tax=Novosphingobium sp. BW1 TaxID=2592621 RepID=UPI0011DEFDDE|nr:hypothetical protein [Novosphingobium sp. BW1]TYC90060.1 hypothetical protein FMM79_08525 [Novosphingobium sp. BW1]
MADKMRKTKGGKPPISRHPIFPAIIALWCGALAGLCSIALRPAVVEQAILATGLDTLVPMAAPPLGATFRIALTLAMTGIGALLGGFLALRIVRPRPPARARADGAEMARNEAPATAPAAAPAAPAAARAPAGRRRALANMELETASAQEASAETAQAPEDCAPEAPAPFVQPETAAAPAPAVAPLAETERGEIAEGILDMRAFDLDAYLDSAQKPTVQPDAMPAPSGAEAPDGPLALEDNVSPSRPIPPEAQLFRTSAPSAAAPDTDVPAAPGQRLFDAYSQAIAAKTAAPGFSLLPHKDEASAESAESWDEIPTVSEPAVTDQPGSAPTAPANAPEVMPFAAAAMAEFTAGAGPRSGAERIAARELDELSPIELLERLALAMTRRRETEARDAAKETPEEPASEPSSRSAPAMPAPYSPETAAEAPQVPTPSAEEEAPPVALARGPFAAPNSEATTPEPSAHEAAQTTPEKAHAAKPGMPAAMRGIDFDAFEDDDDEALPDYIPARLIRAPEPPSAPSPAPFAAPAGLAPAEPEENDAEEESVLEQGYSSLLGLSRQAQDAPSFVRIEEPEGHDEIEPVVIFPGEEARSQAAHTSSDAPRPFDAAPAGDSEPLAFPRQLQADASHPQPRRFDAPAREDAEETEKALRAALATLQRMSGAA